MSYTDADTGVVSYDAVGAEYIILAVIGNLFSKLPHEKEEIEKVYASFVRKVV